MSPFRPQSKLPRTLHLALFAIGLLWLLASRVGAQSAADGISRAIHADILRGVLSAGFRVILLLTGFTALDWVALRDGSFRSTNALPERSTAAREWEQGAAIGWVLLLTALLPMLLTGALHPAFWLQPRAWGLSLLSLSALLLGSLATELAFRGFLFRNLIAATGPFSATLILSIIYALTATSSFNTTSFSFVVALLLGLLFSMAYLRTHALWIGWGLRFGWTASMALLFGLPVAGSVESAGVVATDTSGPVWISGGNYGPEGALVTAFVLIAGLFLLYRFTRDYAWQYTHTPIVAAGYPMDVAPPAAHVAMERAAPPPPLVQILGSTPSAPSTAPAIVEHLETSSARRDLGREEMHDPEQHSS